MFISPQISKKKNKTAITTRSHALSLKAQGAIKTSPSPWSAAPTGRWSRTSKLWERIKRKLAKYLKKTNCQLLELIPFRFLRNILQQSKEWYRSTQEILFLVAINTNKDIKLK